MRGIEYKPIGIIHSPYQSLSGMPIQPAGAEGVAGTVEIDAQYREGIKDLSGFSHIILIYHFHMAKSPSLLIRPYMDDEPHGIFATRYPDRPNPIGISVVRLVKVEECVLHIEDVDILDGTPLLDIKPYVPEFDVRLVESIGWLSGRAEKVSKAKSR
jgi:tRNA-Thr(GGU) m(6)t(6)A37 methyltransferase TsaA